MSATSTLSTIPGYVTGIWDVDPVHSEVSFVARHLVVGKVRGRFDRFTGTIVTADDPLQSRVDAMIEAASVNTNEPQRDAHVRSGDFLDVENFPSITFHSLAIRERGDRILVDGDLTIRGIARAATLDLEANSFIPDPEGETRAGFLATTEINRHDFGVSYNGPIPGVDRALALSDKVILQLEIEAVLRRNEGTPRPSAA